MCCGLVGELLKGEMYVRGYICGSVWRYRCEYEQIRGLCTSCLSRAWWWVSSRGNRLFGRWAARDLYSPFGRPLQCLDATHVQQPYAVTNKAQPKYSDCLQAADNYKAAAAQKWLLGDAHLSPLIYFNPRLLCECQKHKKMGCELTKLASSIQKQPEQKELDAPKASQKQDPRLPLTDRQKYIMISSWKGVQRAMEDTGVNMFLQLVSHSLQSSFFISSLLLHFFSSSKCKWNCKTNQNESTK